MFIRRLDDQVMTPNHAISYDEPNSLLPRQVKVNGYRIELAEVEAVLGAYPPVAQAVVVVREGKLVAYVTGAQGAVFDERELARLNAFAARSLTSYMMPRYEH